MTQAIGGTAILTYLRQKKRNMEAMKNNIFFSLFFIVVSLYRTDRRQSEKSKEKCGRTWKKVFILSIVFKNVVITSNIVCITIDDIFLYYSTRSNKSRSRTKRNTTESQSLRLIDIF